MSLVARAIEEAGIPIMFNVSRSHNYHLIRQGAGVAVANGMSYGGAIKSLTSIPSIGALLATFFSSSNVFAFFAIKDEF